jgi:hypothetical protein
MAAWVDIDATLLEGIGRDERLVLPIGAVALR